MEVINVNVLKEYDNDFYDSWAVIKLTSGIHLRHDPTSDICFVSFRYLQYSNESSKLIEKINHHKKVIVFELSDISDTGLAYGFPDVEHSYDVLARIESEVIFVTINHHPQVNLDNVVVITNDFCHNRSKLYYTSNLINFVNGFMPNYYESENFSIPVLPMEFTKKQLDPTEKYNPICKNKLFLFASRIPKKYRKSIANTLEPYRHEGYYFFHDDAKDVPNYQPFDSTIYEYSFINIFNETNMKNYIWVKSEKTLEPLIRCQMILPLASKGYNRYLESVGYKIIPDLIKISWDDIDDSDKRTKAYCNNLTTILNEYNINDLNNMYYDNLGLILDNKNNFFDTPFDKSVRKLLDYVE